MPSTSTLHKNTPTNNVNSWSPNTLRVSPFDLRKALQAVKAISDFENSKPRPASQVAVSSNSRRIPETTCSITAIYTVVVTACELRSTTLVLHFAVLRLHCDIEQCSPQRREWCRYVSDNGAGVQSRALHILQCVPTIRRGPNGGHRLMAARHLLTAWKIPGTPWQVTPTRWLSRGVSGLLPMTLFPDSKMDLLLSSLPLMPWQKTCFETPKNGFWHVR